MIRISRTSAGFLVAALASTWAAATETPVTLEAVMAGMAGTRGVVAEFREVKEVALLKRPLESRGVLHFVPPDRLARRTRTPSPSALVVDGEQVWFADGSGSAPADLSNDPAARQFVDNFVVLFSGDLAALRERYETAFDAGASAAAGWSLRLVPRDARIRRFVSEIALRGADDGLREMVLVETDGDRTVTHFEQVDSDYAHTPEELDELFGR